MRGEHVMTGSTPANPEQLSLPMEKAPAARPVADSGAAFHLLYTIGHSNLAADDLVRLLQQHNVTVLVDVRSAPYSRYVPHFNKTELEKLLPSARIDYRFAGDYLGGQPKDPSVYRQQTVPDDETSREDFLKLVDYLAVMERDWYQRGIARLLDLIGAGEARDEHVAVMCSEGDPFECHRHHLIARSLVDPHHKITDTPLEVRHILKDGTAQAVNPAAFAEAVNQLRLF